MEHDQEEHNRSRHFKSPRTDKYLIRVDQKRILQWKEKEYMQGVVMIQEK